MYYVLTPSYDYDDEPKLHEFSTKEEVLQFVEKDLKRNNGAYFHNLPEDYAVIDGKKITLKAVEYVSKVEFS